MDIIDEVKKLLASDTSTRAHNLLDVISWAVGVYDEDPETKFLILGDSPSVCALRSTDNTSFRDLIYMLEQAKMVLMADGVENLKGALNVTVDLYLSEKDE